jgi:hypothetical protein
MYNKPVKRNKLAEAVTLLNCDVTADCGSFSQTPVWFL